MIYYLYVKTHNKTGLKYLGKTENDNVEKYQGSGKFWKRHIKKHGYDVSTEIIGAFDCNNDLRIAGLFWSKKWNIVKNPQWANLKEETGDGGASSDIIRIKMSLRAKQRKGIPCSLETREKIRLAKLGKSTSLKGKTYEQIYGEKAILQKQYRKVAAIKDNHFIPSRIGTKHSEETKRKISQTKTGVRWSLLH